MRIWSAPGAEEETDDNGLRPVVLARPPARPGHVYPRVTRASDPSIVLAPPPALTPPPASVAPLSKPEVASCTRLKIGVRIALASSDD